MTPARSNIENSAGKLNPHMGSYSIPQHEITSVVTIESIPNMHRPTKSIFLERGLRCLCNRSGALEPCNICYEHYTVCDEEEPASSPSRTKLCRKSTLPTRFFKSSRWRGKSKVEHEQAVLDTSGFGKESSLPIVEISTDRL